MCRAASGSSSRLGAPGPGEGESPLTRSMSFSDSSAAFLPVLFTFQRMCMAFSFILGFTKVLGSRRAGVCYKDCSCVKWQAAWAAMKPICQAQLQCPNASEMLRKAFSVREEAESLPPWG